jgi:nitrate reductase gamma subunit
MNGLLMIQLLSYASFLVFIIGAVVAVMRYASMPVHLRWDLYPVAHEKGRDYGGSYLEEMDWWTKPRSQTLVGELKYMAREGLLFEQCFKRNRGLWYLTYPFHLGVFLIALWVFLILLGAVTLLLGIAVLPSSNAWGRLVFYATMISGVIGFVVCLITGLGLLIKRLLDPDLRPYTVPADYINLLVILVVVAVSVWAWSLHDTTFAFAREYVKSLIIFSPTQEMDTVLSVNVILFSLFFAYMNFSQMRHGLAKYFTYHRVRWEDEPNLRGSLLERKITKLLERRVSWAAPHIQQGDTWAEAVVRNGGGDSKGGNDGEKKKNETA